MTNRLGVGELDLYDSMTPASGFMRCERQRPFTQSPVGCNANDVECSHRIV